MSNIGNKIGHRYDDIISYFKRNMFGSQMMDLTVLSFLPPVDRCLIMERIAKECRAVVIVLIDKLSMAYLKAGWENLAQSFITACYRRGLILSMEYHMMSDKISNLVVYGVSEDYDDALNKLPRDRSEFIDLIRNLCETYCGQEVFSGVSLSSWEDVQDMELFIEERRIFIDSI